METVKKNARKKILIMAGGTGGHVFPALSIARYLQAKGVAVEWLGTRKGLEAQVIPKAAIPIHYIAVGGLRGKSRWTKALAPLAVSLAVLQSLGKLLKAKPNCVLGMGGFATGPGGIAAWLLRRKLIIHEQNAIAGFTNQMLFPFATTVLEAFPGAFERKRQLPGHRLLKGFIEPGKAFAVGNPVRPEISGSPPPQERFRGRDGPLRLLVVGGSLGAAAINRIIPALLAALPEGKRPDVLHQCGARNLDATLAQYAQHGRVPGESLRVSPFIEDMAQAYCWADLVICRAGALTVAELAGVGVGSVLIPFPHAVDDHQSANAAFLSGIGAAIVIRESELSVAALKEILERFDGNRTELERLASAARAGARPEATETVGTKCLELCHAG